MIGARHKSVAAGISVQQWTERQFAESRAQWQELLNRSAADPLFMSWDWQWRWWVHHAKLLDAHLHLLAAYDEAGALVGLAPLYSRRAVHRGYLSGTRLETIGSTWRDTTGVFSEYLDVIADKSCEQDVIDALAAALAGTRDWSDLVIANARVDGCGARLIEALARLGYLRTVDHLEGYVAALPADFSEYVRALDGGTRRKLWNHRSRLTDPVLRYAQASEVDAFLDHIDRYHIARWGQPLFTGTCRRLHSEFASAMAAQGALRMSTLVNDGKPLSLMYNVQLGTAEYNLQSGFDSEPSAKVSPGYVHFGFCIEDACKRGVRRFDFLAGEGKARQYKKDFLTQRSIIATFQIVRSRPLSWLYRSHDLMQRVRRAQPEESAAENAPQSGSAAPAKQVDRSNDADRE